jgi:hypothetical protein
MGHNWIQLVQPPTSAVTGSLSTSRILDRNGSNCVG